MGRFAIDISNEQTSLPVDEVAVRGLIDTLLRIELVESAEISVAIVDDPTIHELNNRYLEHDYPTDVISFALHDRQPDRSTRETLRSEGERIDGEVIVSADTAIRTAAEFEDADLTGEPAPARGSTMPDRPTEGHIRRWSAHDELLLYVAHGLLHVIGYDDSTVEERNLMRSREQAVLRGRGIEPRYHEDDGPHGDDHPAERDLPAGRDEFGEDS